MMMMMMMNRWNHSGISDSVRLFLHSSLQHGLSLCRLSNLCTVLKPFDGRTPSWNMQLLWLTSKDDLRFTTWQHRSPIPHFTKLLLSLLLLLLLLLLLYFFTLGTPFPREPKNYRFCYYL